MNSSPITTSIFDLFKVGPGPSSSHTIGPMKAAYDFLQRLRQFPETALQRATALHIHLYGSLSATGKGHGTDRAIVAGLLGWQPETTNPDALMRLLKDLADAYSIHLGAATVSVNYLDLIFEKKRYDSPYVNTMVLCLLAGGELLAEDEYYSIGGGFIIRKGEVTNDPADAAIPYPYGTMKELKAHLSTSKLPLETVLLANEMALTGRSAKEINTHIDQILDFMHKAVRRGLRQKGTLSGSIKLRRKAPMLFKQAQGLSQSADSFLIFLNACCLAASEENAAGGIVVTAPTSGASGVIPGLTYLAKHHFHYDKITLRKGMWAAAAIGFLVKHNASISGAEMAVGRCRCMGEIGTASAMGAALLTYAAGKSIDAVESAAEIGIEHHLGMTCDGSGRPSHRRLRPDSLHRAQRHGCRESL